MDDAIFIVSRRAANEICNMFGTMDQYQKQIAALIERTIVARGVVSHATMVSQIEAAVLAEREACAKIADAIEDSMAEAVAAQIRARK